MPRSEIEVLPSVAEAYKLGGFWENVERSRGCSMERVGARFAASLLLSDIMSSSQYVGERGNKPEFSTDDVGVEH